MKPLLALDTYEHDRYRNGIKVESEIIIIAEHKSGWATATYVDKHGFIVRANASQFRILRPATSDDWERLYGEGK